MPQSSELRVFISSTFRDLQEEREHLVKKIFPEIRALCRERGVTFTDIDLRWGLTEEQAVLGTVIRTCLEEVDKCRPYFVGIIGNRYGWVPEYHEIMMDADLLAKYPWIEDVALEGASLTEMEFIHGVFGAPVIDGEYAFFYRRPGNIAESDDPARLALLIERSQNSGKPFREFQSVEGLGQQVRSDLVAMIDSHWPMKEAPTALELQRRAHAAYAASRIRAYIPNPHYLKRFNEWEQGLGVSNDGLAKEQREQVPSPTSIRHPLTPLIISGASGLGKSSLVAYLTEHYRKKNPTAFVIEHYIGASQSSGSATSVMRHVIEEISARFEIDEEIPVNEKELERSFPNWLYRCERLASLQGISVMIVIDAVNQTGASDRRMLWLPETIPSGIRLVVSTTPGETEDRLLKRGWSQLEVQPVLDERVRQSIVVRYLGEYHKGISAEQVRRVTEDAKARSPMYLRVVAEELRLHGEHETLDATIDRYSQASDLLEVFERVLERMEGDYGEQSIRSMLSLIGASRSGLNETELMELTGMNRLELSRLLFALDYHLIQHNGLLGFFHEYLRRAVQKRYNSDEQQQHALRLQLTEYFEGSVSTLIAGSGVVPARMAGELAYQLHAAEAVDRLQECLSTIPVFLALYTDEMQYDVMGYWSEMAEGSDIEGSYRRGLERWGVTDAHERSAAMGLVAELLEGLGSWAGALALQRERLASAITRSDQRAEAASRVSLGSLLQARGESTEALQELARAKDLFAALDDRHGIAVVLRNIGIIHTRSGEYDRALENLQLALSISEELGDRASMAGTAGNIGIIYYRRREFDRALGSFQGQLSMCQEVGDRRGVAGSLHNIGLVYDMQGRSDEALPCYQQALAINTALGNRQWIAYNLGAMGIVFRGREEYDRALECFQRQANIGEELGDRHGVAGALGNMGSLYANLREHERALHVYYRAAEEHHSVGDRVKLTYWLQGIAQILLVLVQAADEMPAYLPTYVPGATIETWKAVSLQRARECAEECIAISDDLSKPDTQFHGRIVLGRIEAAEGNVEGAVERLREMLVEATDEAQRAELHYWLWKIGAPDHARTALALYESLYASIPTHEYHDRIEELKTAGEQP